MENSEIVNILKTELRRVSAARVPINMNRIGVTAWDGAYKVDTSFGKPCGVCAIGAHLLGQPARHSDADDFAKSFGKHRDWGYGFIQGSAYNAPRLSAEDSKFEGADYTEGYNLGRRIAAWVSKEQKEGRLPKNV
jgi:hypothetical protein